MSENNPRKLKVGDVVRLGDWPFADAVVVRVDENGEYADLHRPFAYCSLAGGTSLIGTEHVTHARCFKNIIDTGRVR